MSDTFVIAARIRLKKKSVTAWLRSPWPDADAIVGLDAPFAGGPWAGHAGLAPLPDSPRSVRHGLAALADAIAADESGCLVCAWNGAARAVLVYHVMIGWQPEAAARTAYALAAASAHWTSKKPARVVVCAETSGRLSAEGRLAVRSPAALERLRRRGQIAFRYARGGLAARPGSPEPGPVPYPDCPNGSVDAIAGLCAPTGRVLGLMPHPERNVTPWHHPHWTRLGERSEGEGLPFFRSLVEYAAQSADLPITTEA